MSMVEVLRDADRGEAAALEDLQRRSSMVWEEYRAQLTAHPDAIRLPADQIRDQQVRVATGGGRILGFSVVLLRREGRCELDGLFVEPECMGSGVGRALVEDVVATARQWGRHVLDVTANPRAVAFYKRVGFRPDAAVPTRFGTGLRMHRDLAARGARRGAPRRVADPADPTEPDVP